MVEVHLRKLGFSQKEIITYLALAEVGKANATALSKRIGLPRTTVYSILENLKKKGLVSLEQKKKNSLFLPNKPDAVIRGIEEEKRTLARKERAARELLPLLEPFFKSKWYSIPKLQFFEGKTNVNAMLHDYAALWLKSIEATDFTWWGYQDHTFVENYLEYLQWSWPQQHPDMKIYLISNEARIEKKLTGKVKNRIIRPVSVGEDFSSTIWAIGDYIVLIMSRNEPHYAFQLHHPVFASNLRTVFRLLWDKL